jgi:GR25 family glycosyltransferase involved in LPS biosynthesis
MPLTHVVLINLDRSADRLARFRAVNGFLPRIDRFAAIDGRSVDREKMKSEGLLDPRVSYTDGALGVALSHFALWDRAVRDGVALTICEDDAVLNRGFVPRADALLDTLPGGWDFVLWGWNFDQVLLVDALPGVSPCLMYCDQAHMRARADSFQALDIEPKALRLLRAFGLMCYTVTPRGAQMLLAACRPIRAMSIAIPGVKEPLPNYGVDSMCNAAYASLNAFVAFPPLAVSPNEHASSLVQTL